MKNGRRGLRRIGMREYEVAGPFGTFIIERTGHSIYRLRRAGLHRVFYSQQFYRLYDARDTAETWAGLKLPPAFDPMRLASETLP